MSTSKEKLAGVFSSPRIAPAVKPRGQVIAPAFREPYPPDSFKYKVASGLWVNIRPETRGKFIYWYLDKQVKGRRYHLYLCKAGELTRQVIENAAREINAG